MGSGGSRIGAGRPAYRVKAEHLQRLDVRQLAKLGALTPGFHSVSWDRDGEALGSVGLRVVGADALSLEYAVDGRPTAQSLPLLQTACHLGGFRHWFGCPACSRRVGVLYLRHGRFACRGCQRVAYASQSEDACGRTWRAQQKIEKRLGEDWHKPKWMRWATHDRLVDRLAACEEIRDGALASFVARLMSGRV